MTLLLLVQAQLRKRKIIPSQKQVTQKKEREMNNLKWKLEYVSFTRFLPSYDQ